MTDYLHMCVYVSQHVQTMIAIFYGNVFDFYLDEQHK